MAHCYYPQVIAPLPLTDPQVALHKPMAKAARVTLFEREIRERLSQPALEILLDSAEVLSEGERIENAPALEINGPLPTIYGSAMLTIDLVKVADRVREICNEETAGRVATQIASDERVSARLRHLAAQVATRLAGAAVDNLTTEIRVRTRHATIFIDIDFTGRA